MELLLYLEMFEGKYKKEVSPIFDFKCICSVLWIPKQYSDSAHFWEHIHALFIEVKNKRTPGVLEASEIK